MHTIVLRFIHSFIQGLVQLHIIKIVTITYIFRQNENEVVITEVTIRDNLDLILQVMLNSVIIKKPKTVSYVHNLSGVPLNRP